MVQLRFGTGMVTEARGSIDGITYSNGLGGAYARTKVSPMNPQTPAQAAVRAVMAETSQAWASTLTEDQRIAWNEWAKINKVTNSLGEQVTMNGLAAFVQLNSRVLILQTVANPYSTMILNPPADNTVPALVNITNVILGVDVAAPFVPTLRFRTAPNTPTIANMVIIARTSGALRPGATSTKQPVVFMGAADRVTPALDPYEFELWQHRPDVAATINLPGQLVAIQAQILNRTNGAITPPVRRIVTVTPQ